MHDSISRKTFLASSVAAAIGAILPSTSAAQAATPAEKLTVEDVKAFLKVAGLEFTDEEIKAALPEIQSNLAGYRAMRKLPEPSYLIEPPTTFRVDSAPSGKRSSRVRLEGSKVVRPRKDDDLAFLTVAELAALIRSRELTCTEITNIYLSRLEKYGPRLECVVTLLAERARGQAKVLDEELARGKYRGPLHGIPFGVKDILSIAGIRTTWGAEPYKDQVFEHTAEVVERLERAGAIPVAKTSVGALAYNNIWFGGATKNPWNFARGSSGSSAGSASGMAAGLFAFAIGTETLGSIMSPSNECRVTGLRPTYGRVSRYGCMGLSYTMDKIGPIARTAQDAALVFSIIHGRDDRDNASTERPFAFSPRKYLKGVKIGVLGVKPADWEKDLVLAVAKGLGAELIEAKVPEAPAGALTILDAEGAAAFDELTRSGRVNLIKDSIWPNGFRAARMVPAVEYLAAQRHRVVLMQQFQKALEPFDLLFDRGIGEQSIVQTNLTGNPQVLIPLLPTDRNLSASRSLIGKLFDEQTILEVAWIIQKDLDFYRLQPNFT